MLPRRLHTLFTQRRLRAPEGASLSDAARRHGSAPRKTDRARALRRARIDAMRAEARAKGRTDMQPIDWSNFP